jgi:Fur family ferric uptake transcriptional regulator
VPSDRGDLDQVLRRNGLQVTAQRLALLGAVAARPHATADDLTDDVRAIIGTVSRQAIYDSLGVLVEKQLVRRIQPAGSPARYESRVGDNHHHLICRGCGTTFDVDCAVGDVPCLTADDDHGFEIDEAEVIYWGRCAACCPAAVAAPTTDTAASPRKRKEQR